MVDMFFIFAGLIYGAIIILLFIFGINFYYMSRLALRKHAPSVPADPDVWPNVTVQLPVYNEMYVVERLISAAACLDYPRDRLEIQVLDDSTDETAALALAAVQRVRAQGINIVHLHRDRRDGYKAGALAAGLSQASGELLAIFDADFVPTADFLRRTIPYFQDSKIAFLQTRWGHLNPNYSLLTFLQSLIIDAHFMVEQVARSRSGYWFNFNGTAGVWRKTAVQDAGGWKADTLTEDLDLSYRVLLRGWQAAYLPDVVVPAELPVTFSAYRRQQYRWARGSLEVALKQAANVLRAPISMLKKFEALLHLTGYGLHILLFVISLLYPVILFMPVRYPHLMPLFYFAQFFNTAALAQTIFYVTAQHKLGRRWWLLLPAIFVVSALGAGMMLNTVRAALQMFIGKRVAFERTPKFGIDQVNHSWKRKHYQNGLDTLAFFELGFAIYNGLSAWLAAVNGNWVIAYYAITFCIGLLFAFWMSVQQAGSQWLHSRKKTVHTAPVPQVSKTQPDAALQTGSLPARQNSVHLMKAILKTVAYADIFDFPMSGREIHRYLIGMQSDMQGLQMALDEGCRTGSLSFRDGWYMLPGREALVEVRQRRSQAAQRLWKYALRYGFWIARLPFVRMVSVTGALAMDNVERNADIDFLIVTEAGRLWLCRGLVILLVRWARLQGVVLCPNYLISERAMIFPDHSLYAAHELAQMVPLHGIDLYARLRQQNGWVSDYLPNAAGAPSTFILSKAARKNAFQSLAEAVLRSPAGGWLEQWEMQRKIRKFTEIRAESPEIDFSPDWCKGHFDRHGQRTQECYAEIMEKIEMGELAQVEP